MSTNPTLKTPFSESQMAEIETLIENYVPSSVLFPQRAKVVITNAQVAILNATPITIVTAPGAGYATKIINCVVFFQNASGDDYQTNMQINLITSSGSTVIASSRNDFLGGVSSEYYQYLILQQALTQNDSQMVENDSIKLICDTGNPSPNGSPDVTLTVYVTYETITL